jgi:large subunit ribosomal protein L22
MAVKTNELPGTKAILRHCRMSASKAREVLDLIRGMEYTRAAEILAHTDRAAATVIAKLLRSAAANAEHNDLLDPTELYVASCYADEGTTLKRWRPRARGRATRIRKRSCHITIVLARMPENRLARQRSRTAANLADRRARRVAGTRRRDAVEGAPTATPNASEVAEEMTTGLPTDEVTTDEAVELDDATTVEGAEEGTEASAAQVEPEEAVVVAEDVPVDDAADDGAADNEENAVDEEPEDKGDDGGEAV